MDKEEIFKRVADIIKKEFVESSKTITRDTKFEDDLAIDSLDLIELVMSVEDSFDIRIDEQRFDVQDDTVGQLCDIVEEELLGAQND